jgi:hypothetical protein
MMPTHVPAFVAEVRDQARAAHEARLAAIEAGDNDAAEVASARLADLADVVRQYATDLAAMLEFSPLLVGTADEDVPLRVAG